MPLDAIRLVRNKTLGWLYTGKAKLIERIYVMFIHFAFSHNNRTVDKT
jgi:hypothetical protein